MMICYNKNKNQGIFMKRKNASWLPLIAAAAIAYAIPSQGHAVAFWCSAEAQYEGSCWYIMDSMCGQSWPFGCSTVECTYTDSSGTHTLSARCSNGHVVRPRASDAAAAIADLETIVGIEVAAP